MVSPGRNSGAVFSALFLLTYLLNNAFCMTISVKTLVYNSLRIPWRFRYGLFFQQIRPQSRGLLPSRVFPESTNLRMISVQQDVRDLPPPEFRRTRPVRAVEQAFT